jgi:hypothetical protein
MKSSVFTLGVHDTLRDFTADRRLLVLSAMAVFTGSFGAGAAWVLLKLIALVTHLAYFHVYSTATTYLSHARLGPSSATARRRSAGTAFPRRSRPSSSARAGSSRRSRY